MSDNYGGIYSIVYRKGVAMLTTTFAALHHAGACPAGYRKLATALGGVTTYGDTTPIPIARIMETNGLDDTLWVLTNAIPEDKHAERDRTALLFAADCASHVLPLWTAKCPDDMRPAEAIAVARRFAAGQATREELTAAAEATGAARAARAAWAAWAARAAAWAARAAAEAAWATGAAARAAEAAEREWQAARLMSLLTGKEAR